MAPPPAATNSEEALQDVIAHFAKVNGVDTGLFDSHLNKAMKEWRRLSQRDFIVNFEKYADGSPR